MIIRWKDMIYETATGIKLENPQAIERTGEMISNQVFPMQNGNQVMFAMAIAAGCNDYIAKPYNKTSLTALLKKYF